MKNIYSIITVVSIVVLFLSCRQDYSSEIQIPAGEVEVEMNILAPTLAHTRAWVVDEDKINNLYVLVFSMPQGGSEDDAAFLYYRHAWLSGTNTYRAVLKTGTNLNIYFAANVEDLILEADLEDDTYTFAQVREKLILTKPNEIRKGNLPMWGVVSDKTISESNGLVNLGTVKLLRSVASADLEITDPQFGFENAGMVLATNKGFLMHEMGNVNSEGKIIAPKVPENAVYNFGNGYTWTEPATNNKVVNKFYMFENDATADTAPDKRYTKLIVAGRYNGGGITYYPLSFYNANKTKVQVARNRKFDITITKVNGKGYPTVDEAINAEDVEMGFEVIIWDGYEYETEIIVDGTKYVSFPKGKTILLADQEESDALLWLSTNALEWVGESPANLVWSFNNFITETTLDTISNDRFTVSITNKGDESYCLLAIADKAYEDVTGGSHEATLSIRVGNIQFAIDLQQLENGWNEGSKHEVDL